ncbi:MAG: hypothetical protein LQ338_000104 [Usnochroma carphineum]|nr:MAG: hypothetical protein LQ338_000104 [Usnochroma carphineum]
MSPAVQTTTSTTSTTTTSAEVTSSPLPAHASPKSSSSAPIRPHPKPEYPTCKLRIKCHDLNHRGAEIFFSSNIVWRDLSAAVTIVLSTLYEPRSQSVIPPVRSVTLILGVMEGIAYTTGSELDDDHKELHFSLNYISELATKPTSRQRDEIQGVLVHEMVHCWQWNAYGTAPGGLIEGIADFVRLKAGLSPPHWKKERGETWDQGYQHTGYFLDWIETEYGDGSTRRVNEALMNKRYDEEAFWNSLFGKGVQELWSEYCKTLPDQDRDNAVTVEKEDQSPRDQLEKVLE